jgi:hypothetical protein
VKLSLDSLASDPELAALALLDHALGVAVLALAAAWPELQSDDIPQHPPSAVLEVIDLARALGFALRRYRRVLGATRRRQYDLPF